MPPKSRKILILQVLPQNLSGVCRCAHFSETLHGQDAERPMTFDYRLRPGLATTTNALRLLEIVGLGQPERGPLSDAD